MVGVAGVQGVQRRLRAGKLRPPFACAVDAPTYAARLFTRRCSGNACCTYTQRLSIPSHRTHPQWSYAIPVLNLQRRVAIAIEEKRRRGLIAA